MEKRNKYKFILFDFFGVICSEIAPIWLVKYFPEDQVIEIKNKYLPPADKGDISSDVLFEQLGDLVKKRPDEVKNDWFSLVTINNELASFIEELKTSKPEFKIVLCSNSPSSFLRQILKDHDLEELFNDIIISSEIRLIKPNDDFYMKTLEILEAKPEEIFYIDDNPKNVQAAENLGITSLIFDGDRSLSRLRELISK